MRRRKSSQSHEAAVDVRQRIKAAQESTMESEERGLNSRLNVDDLTDATEWLREPAVL